MYVRLEAEFSPPSAAGPGGEAWKKVGQRVDPVAVPVPVADEGDRSPGGGLLVVARVADEEAVGQRDVEAGRGEMEDRRIGLPRPRLVGRRHVVQKRQKTRPGENPPREGARRVRGDAGPDSPGPGLGENRLSLGVRPDQTELPLEEAGVRRVDLLDRPFGHVRLPVGLRPVAIDRVEGLPRDRLVPEVDERLVVDGEPGLL